MKRLLIANRGEIARRIIRTAHAMGIETVAVFSDADQSALHVRQATTAYALGGQLPADSYLRIDKLITAALATGADAVHPGYGFLSENPDFAQAVLDAGLIWVGPSPASIRVLGSKASAKRLAQAAGVPCLPGFDGLNAQGQPDTHTQSDATLQTEANRIGYPLMVKAINGGGGRGMRRVDRPEDLIDALASARQEALSAFGDSSLLLEHALIHPRHIEVQVFGDQHGQVVHLSERDCSVQRRNQKIIEESPSPVLSEALRQQATAAAVALAKAAHYVGAGTVEFLLVGAQAAQEAPTVREVFFLMEMNTRLQVEHPVTEMRYGIDLVEWQIRVARGEALPLQQHQLQPQGHALELRLCAEDEHFVPHSGTVVDFDEAPAPARTDHCLEPGSHISPFYDPMLGKLIVHGPDRQQAIDRALLALGNTRILGLRTNRPLLQAILNHADFREGRAHIAWLTEQQTPIAASIAKGEDRYLALAALIAMVTTPGGTGQQPSPLACRFSRPVVIGHRGQRWSGSVTRLDDAPNNLEGLRAGHSTWLIQGPALSTPVQVMLSSSSGNTGQPASLRWQAIVNGHTHRIQAVTRPGSTLHLDIDGVEMWISDHSLSAQPSAQGSATTSHLRSPMNGKVLAVLVQPGSTVNKGDTLAILESMKLEHRLQAGGSGTVQSVQVQPGQQASTGQLLIELAPASQPS